jgi:hypothetical protein
MSGIEIIYDARDRYDDADRSRDGRPQSWGRC